MLLAEDDERIRSGLLIKLTQIGHEVTCANDGKDAIAICGREEFDTVVTDILMPNKDGFELIREIRVAQPDVCIVAISGGGRGSGRFYLDVAKALGADAVLPKPFSFSELAALLQSCCSRADSGCEGGAVVEESRPVRKKGLAKEGRKARSVEA